jgi:hypothetical protein
MLDEGASFGVELGRTSPAIEEFHAELLLQVPNLEADGRRRESDGVRRGGETPIVFNRDKGSQLAQFHVSSHHRWGSTLAGSARI